jgi:UDPglucose 6-dehydrogenase
MAYGGPCFPRDTQAFTALAQSAGASADLARATHRINVRQTERLVERVKGLLKPGRAVAVLGLTYKPHTGVSEESAGMALAVALALEEIPVVAYDPAVTQSAALAELHVRHAASIRSAVEAAQVIVVATPWPEFSSIDQRCLRGDRVVVDCWGLLADSPGVVRVGQG